jgi:transposase
LHKLQPSPLITVLLSLKGIGTIVVATLLAEANQPLRDRDYHVLRILCGVAPVTKRSGKMLRVQMRYACNQRLRNAVYHWARGAAYNDQISKQAYAALRHRGHTHGHALRSIADRLLKVACAMLRDGTLYDPTKRKSYSTLEKID